MLLAGLLSVLPAAGGWVWQPVGEIGGPEARRYAVVAWTGSELLVWGGLPGGLNQKWLNDGWRYDPANDSWSPMPSLDAPETREFPVGVWTGCEWVIWGGLRPTSPLAGLDSGGVYRPDEDCWRAMSREGAPTRRYDHSLTWTGREVIVWGGYSGALYLNTGARYDPTTDAWVPVTATGAPTRRSRHTAIWIGSRLVVWGGGVLLSGGIGQLVYIHRSDFAAYDPTSDSWTPGQEEGAPRARSDHAAVWTGVNMLVWGGWGGAAFDLLPLADGSSLDPDAGTWRPLPPEGSPAVRLRPAAVWSGREWIIWGGSPSLASGDRFEPATGNWTAMPVAGGPSGGSPGGMAWTGEALYVYHDGLYRAHESGPYALDGLPDAWQYEHFGVQDAQGAADQDPDGDGLPNDAECGLGTDPNDPSDARGGLVVTYEGVGASRRAVLNFRRRNDAAGIAVQPEYSTDLANWRSDDAVFDESVAVDLGCGYDAVSVRTRPSLCAAAEGFFRLRVVRELSPRSVRN